MTRAFVLAALVALSGCLPTLSAQSAQPPGRTARLDEVHGFWGLKGYTMELSHGAAIAVACTRGGPCRDLAVASDDPSIAEVRRASLGTLERAGISNQATSTAVVVVGKAAGQTRIRVTTRDGGRVIPITVITQPAAIQTRATEKR
jgi:hypothetical protein